MEIIEPSKCPRVFNTRTAARRFAKAQRPLHWVYRCAVCDRWHTGAEQDAPPGVRLYAAHEGRRRG